MTPGDVSSMVQVYIVVTLNAIWLKKNTFRCCKMLVYERFYLSSIPHVWEHLNRNVEDKCGERVKKLFLNCDRFWFDLKPFRTRKFLVNIPRNYIWNCYGFFFEFSLSLQISVLHCFLCKLHGTLSEFQYQNVGW